MDGLPNLFRELFGLINVKSIEALGLKLLAAVVIVLAALWISRMLQRTIDRRLSLDSHNDENTILTYKRVVRYACIIPGTLLALHVLGFNMSTLFTTGGLCALALGFAMKELAENNVSGIMLRLERIIKPGDVLETGGAMVMVKDIGFRATRVKTKDEKDLLIPNALLIKERVANYTYRDSICRLEATVGVAYSSDLKQVQEALMGVCIQLDWTSPKHKPQVLLSDFGDYSVNYKVRVWIENPWEFQQRLGQINDAIWWSLKKANIEIAFPQLDVHFDETLAKAVSPGRAPIEEKNNKK